MTILQLKLKIMTFKGQVPITNKKCNRQYYTGTSKCVHIFGR